MATESKDLIALLAKRAEKRLDADLNNLSQVISSQPLLSFSRHDTNSPMLAYNKLGSDARIAWEAEPFEVLFKEYGSSNYRRQLKSYWLPIYIERESKEFIEKVDSLQEEVNHLFNNQPY